jgi:hypothetical protein
MDCRGALCRTAVGESARPEESPAHEYCLRFRLSRDYEESRMQIGRRSSCFHRWRVGLRNLDIPARQGGGNARKDSGNIFYGNDLWRGHASSVFPLFSLGGWARHRAADANRGDARGWHGLCGALLQLHEEFLAWDDRFGHCHSRGSEKAISDTVCGPARCRVLLASR